MKIRIKDGKTARFTKSSKRMDPEQWRKDRNKRKSERRKRGEKN